MSTPERIREGLVRLFKDSGMTYDDVAEATGQDRMQVWRILHGKVKDPQVDTVRRLIEGMGSTLGEFFVELEGVPDLIKMQGEKDLPLSVVKHDNAAHGAEVSRIDAALLQAVVVSATGELVSAIDRLNTTLAAVLHRLEADDGQAASARAQKTRHR